MDEIHYDTGRISITSGDEDSDRHIKVTLYSYWTRNDGKEMHYEDVLYSVDEPDENLSPIMDLMDGYLQEYGQLKKPRQQMQVI